MGIDHVTGKGTMKEETRVLRKCGPQNTCGMRVERKPLRWGKAKGAPKPSHGSYNFSLARSLTLRAILAGGGTLSSFPLSSIILTVMQM